MSQSPKESSALGSGSLKSIRNHNKKLDHSVSGLSHFVQVCAINERVSEHSWNCLTLACTGRSKLMISA